MLEVRLVGIDKGTTDQKLIDSFKPDFTLCIGDDTTDEDMFRVLRDKGYTIKIGRGNTAAEFTIHAQAQVVPFLQNLFVSRGEKAEAPSVA